ncbi:hypothetical protein [Haloferula sp. A504]|uniref:hypothetical protein n=1 Tax=Haloferula sp. A504 TaxID=3373601 RepID=UPI0031C8F369|nr:hypothetical protein [Verrucomicrobiaceae bacterium E54]
MQLEQPPPDLAIPEATPFDHLRPSLWRASKVAHITLVSLGTIMLLPAGLVMFGLIQFFIYFGGMSAGGFGGMGSEEMLAMGSAVVSSSFGVLAWSALSMLFFKRNDARWQRICWAICGVFGTIASPCILGWIAWISSEGAGVDESWLFLIFWSMFGVALASAIVGFRYSASAHRALQHPPTEEDRSLIG